MDGTLSLNYFNNGSAGSNFSPATLMPFYDFNNISGQCFPSPISSRWDSSLLCNKLTAVRSISISLSPYFYYGLQISRVDPSSNTLLSPQTYYPYSSYSPPFVCGHSYRIEQQYLYNFNHMSGLPSRYMNDSDPAIILRFTYTTSR